MKMKMVQHENGQMGKVMTGFHFSSMGDLEMISGPAAFNIHIPIEADMVFCLPGISCRNMLSFVTNKRRNYNMLLSSSQLPVKYKSHL